MGAKAKKAALAEDEAKFWDFSVQSTAGAPAKFKAKLIFALNGHRPGASAWTEIRLFRRTRQAGGFVLAVSAMREGIGFENLHVAVPTDTLEEALSALERIDVTGEAPCRRAKRPELAIARVAARGRLDSLAREHAALAEQALAALERLDQDAA